MIKSFKHKGLKIFFETGSTKGIQAEHAGKLSLILNLLDEVGEIAEMNFPGSGLHKLKGTMKDHWSVKVSGNWRITFTFENGDAEIVNYQDYH